VNVTELLAHVRDEYALSLTATDVVGGEDELAVVLHTVSTDGSAFALKASRDDLSAGALVSAHLAGQGIDAVPAPLPATSGHPWSLLDDAHQVTVTQWARGRPAARGGMVLNQWRSFGAVLAQIHAARVPALTRARLPVEDYATPAVASVRSEARLLQSHGVGRGTGNNDPLVSALTHRWLEVSDSVLVIADQTEALGRELRGRATPLVLTHGDAHLFNVVVDDDPPALSLIDWGGTALAPRERDLMFVIGGVLTQAPVTTDEQSSFFAGYGDGAGEVDPMRLTYYRCSWAVQDVASYAAQVLDESRPQPQRVHALRLFTDLFEPTGIVTTTLESLRWIGWTGQ
jgi:spectinomycin phosphotransferase